MSTIVRKETVLVRYGVIPEVARFQIATAEPLKRETFVVVETHRGRELGMLLQDVDQRFERIPPSETDEPQILRPANEEDRQQHIAARQDCEAQFETWCERIAKWNLSLELIDLEWLLDRKKLVLYVLNERGPDCTKLALQAAAAGLGTIEVQPVDAQGLVQLEPSGGGGCGSGSGGCGCH